METVKTDVVVVGSGPGGAAVARKMAAAGRSVCILEWGSDNAPTPGRFSSPLRYFGGVGLMRHAIMKTATRPVMNMVRGLGTGGSTMMYAGVCEEPQLEKFTAYGIELAEEIRAIKSAITIQPLVDAQLGEKAWLLAQSARALGLPWKNSDRFFVDPVRFRQGSVFMGDKSGSRWDARRWILESVDRGAVLMNGVFCERALLKGNRAIGVEAVRRTGQQLRVEADTVVLAAGGIGSPQILRQSGVPEAGRTLCNDPYMLAFGYLDKKLSGLPEANRQGCVSLDGVLTVADACVPGMVYLQMLKKSRLPGRLFAGRQALALLFEIADDSTGFLDAEGRVHKTLTEADQQKLVRGKEVTREILLRAGARDIWFSSVSAVHPAGTCRIGDIVDSNLKTRIDGLYVADASVLPEGLGVPPVLSILALGGRLARHLLTEGGHT